MTDYLKPATPLPWTYDTVPDSLGHEDSIYLVRAANAFPHLVAALDWASTAIRPGTDLHNDITAALAIARGEAQT